MSSSSSGGNCREIPLQEIIEATDSFNSSNVIGKGGEGKVYLAKIKLGSDLEITHVAVKRLKKASKQFDVEIKTMSKIQHPNLVSLLGYCDQALQKMLLYEYMEIGSLSHYLKKKTRISMSWQLRVSICIDAARGLSHLHAKTDEYPKGIIHRDVKPDNILLDKNGVAKISDFGLFKLSERGQKQSEMRSNLKGTRGYFAPEYLKYGKVTRMIDVYAFGIVLYQVLCLKSPWEQKDNESYFFSGNEDFALMALENVDPTIKDEITDNSLEIFTSIIGKSMKKDPKERPTMDTVMSNLVEAALGLKSEGTWGSYNRGASEKGKSEANVDDVGGNTIKAEYRGRKAGGSSRGLTKIGLDKLLQATDHFNDAKIIVREDFALTYKGLLKDGRTVAVKRFDKDLFWFYFLIDEEEISLLSKIQSDYIVSIIGMCTESNEMILVHEFMENRTLGYHLLEKESTLSWDQRLKICIDAAKGLEYLHRITSNRMRIIHRNLNPFAIQLDEQWRPKLSDFGFRKKTNATAYLSTMNTRVKGNLKYVDPYYNLTGQFTRRTDTYSFGMVLFDVLFGMEYTERRWRRRMSLNNHSLDLIDERLKGQISLECFTEFVEVASSCTDDDPSDRPKMTKVVEKLEHALRISQKTHPS